MKLFWNVPLNTSAESRRQEADSLWVESMRLIITQQEKVEDAVFKTVLYVQTHQDTRIFHLWAMSKKLSKFCLVLFHVKQQTDFIFG